MAKSSVKTTTNKKNSCPQKTLNLIHYCEQKEKLKIHRKERERERELKREFSRCNNNI
jgi:hypothetical protein